MFTDFGNVQLITVMALNLVLSCDCVLIRKRSPVWKNAAEFDKTPEYESELI